MIYLQLIWSYLKIGLFGFGGGYAMLSLIDSEIVKHGDTPSWGISPQTFTDIVAISQMTPGPIGINSATYIGYTVPGSAGYEGVIWGIIGSLVCTLAVVIPPFLIVSFASHFVSRHKDSAVIKGVMSGLRIVVVGLIASAALLLMNSDNFGTTPMELALSIGICIAAFLVTYKLKIHPIWTITAAGIVGLIVYYFLLG